MSLILSTLCVQIVGGMLFRSISSVFFRLSKFSVESAHRGLQRHSNFLGVRNACVPENSIFFTPQTLGPAKPFKVLSAQHTHLPMTPEGSSRLNKQTPLASASLHVPRKAPWHPCL